MLQIFPLHLQVWIQVLLEIQSMNIYPLTQDPKQGTSSSYLVELRKLSTQKREDNCENDRVGQSRWKACLTRSEKSTRTWGDSQEETWAQRQKERRRHDQVGLRQDETHRLRNETVDEEEDEGVEHSGHLGGLSTSKLETASVGGQENAWAESQKKSGGDRDFLGGNIGEHGYYTLILFCLVCS